MGDVTRMMSQKEHPDVVEEKFKDALLDVVQQRVTDFKPVKQLRIGGHVNPNKQCKPHKSWFDGECKVALTKVYECRRCFGVMS